MAQDQLQLFEKFVSGAASVKIFPEKAPDVARFLAEEIPRYLQEGSKDENDEEPGTSSGQTRRRKRSDPSYCPPKPSKAEGKGNFIPTEGDKLPRAGPTCGPATSEGGPLEPPEPSDLIDWPDPLGELPSPSTAFHGNSFPTLILVEESQYSPAHVHKTAANIEHDLTSTASPHRASLVFLDHDSVTPRSTPKLEQEITMAHGMPSAQGRSAQLVDGQPQAHATSAPEAGNLRDDMPPPTQAKDLKDPKEHMHTASSIEQEQYQFKPDAIRSTPEAQIGVYEQKSPRTEEVLRVDGSLSVVLLESPPAGPLIEAFNFADFLGEMIDVIFAMSGSQDDVPEGAHATILQSLQASVGTMPKGTEVARPCAIWTTANPTTWSGDMWASLLEVGEARSQKLTILNMISYMGAAAWFDAQLSLYEPPLTKKGKPRKRVASPFLDSLLKEKTFQDEEPAKRRKLDFESIERSADQTASISKSVTSQRRRQIIDRVNKGRKLRTMVSKAGFGILLRRKIWDYQKMTDHDFESRLSEGCQADSRTKLLLRILEEQVNILVQGRRTDLALFLSSLASNKILPYAEVSELQAKFGLETHVPKASLDADVDGLIAMLHQMSDKANSDPIESFMVHDSVELTFGSLDRLRPGKWLDMWLIAAAMELTDKPSCVKYGLSIPLDQEKDGKTISIERPFGRWRKKIDEYRGSIGDEGKQIYFCPLNIGMSHFTLLEINEQSGMIYHYNSMATKNAIRGRPGRTRIRESVEAEFKDLGFGYEEAPCPQQKDGSSCGLMVIRNAIRRMNGRAVGSWDDKLQPELMLITLVDLLKAAVQNGDVRLRTTPRRSKRIGVESSLPTQ
ncbi:hypothetical protein BR93DRAFT_965550 [Coniochaeta sp. PMI_546]|nr:hypothetical protein BR93DRAFT_965550 [Coniochaeta sp. PMI_546]